MPRVMFNNVPHPCIEFSSFDEGSSRYKRSLLVTSPISNNYKALKAMKSNVYHFTRGQNLTLFSLAGMELQSTPIGKVIKSKVFVFDVERLVWSKRACLDEPRCMMGIGELGGCLYVTG